MTQAVQIEYLRWVGNEVVRTIVGQVCIGSSTSTKDLADLQIFIKAGIDAYMEQKKKNREENIMKVCVLINGGCIYNKTPSNCDGCCYYKEVIE